VRAKDAQIASYSRPATDAGRRAAADGGEDQRGVGGRYCARLTWQTR
jgi:hypothetical protein